MAETVNIDLDALRRQLLALLEEDRSEEVVSLVVELVGRLAADNQRLAEKLAGFLRGRAHGGSERLSAAQLALFMSQLDEPAPEELDDGEPDAELDDEDADASEADESEKPAPSRRKQIRVVGNVARVKLVSAPPAEDCLCPDCGQPKSPAGGKTRLLVEVIPAQLRIVEHERKQLACKTCDDPHMVIGPAAETPLEGGVLTASLLGDFLARKHADHEPVNRIAQTYRRMGIEFPLGTLYGWVVVGADLLAPLAKRIEENAVAAHVLQVDDTGVVVLDSAVESGSRRGHLWTLLGDETWAAFRYTPDWRAVHAEAFLSVRQGWMQADAYAGYDRFYGRDQAVEVGCWSHARRYFVKALDGGDKRAARPLDIIQRIFTVERRATDKGYTDERRLELRQEKSRPLLNELGRWVDAVHANAPPNTPLGRAITYLKNQWQALVQFLVDGRLWLTNNAAERQLRHIALGRNNWLFTGSDAGGERLATLYTLVATCKLAGVDPRAWFVDVIDKLCRGWKASRLDELLPPNWAAAQKTGKDSGTDEAA